MQGLILNRTNRFSINFLLKVILLFGFIYPFSLRIFGIPDALHASRLSSICIILFALLKSSNEKSIKKNPFYNKYKKVFRLIIFTFFYSLLLSIIFGFGKGSNYLMIVSDNIIFSLLPISAFYIVFNDIDEFADALIYVTFLQSIAILLGTFIPGVSILFTVLFDSNVGYDDGMRNMELMHESYASGIACFTSEGVTRFTIGLVACTYKYLSKKNAIYIVFFLFFSIVNSMLSRIGLLMSLIGAFTILCILFKNNRNRITGVISILAIGIICFFLSNKLSLDFYDRFSRYEEIKDGGIENFIDAYFHDENTVIPPLSFSTIVGTSIISGESGNGVVVNVDGGPIKNYVALGLLLSVLVYLYILIIFILIINCFKESYIKYVLMFYILYIFLSDFKEYFLLYRGTISLFFLFVMLAANKYQLKNKQHKKILKQ